MSKRPLDTSVVEQLKRPIYKTWDQIAPDVGRVTEKEAMELCLDAGRLQDAGAEKLVHDLCAAHGYKAVLKFLSKRIPLL